MTDIRRRLLAEFVGTAALVAVVVGSGIAAQQLTDDVAVQLLANSTATVFGLGVLILVFGPVSGAHFNPVVSLADWLLGRRHGTGLGFIDALAYAIAQIGGAVCGAVLANIMFDLGAWQISTHDRITTGHLVGEVVATAGLIAVIFALARSGRAALSASAVAAYIGAAYWFTSSTSFANPAVTIGRVFSDTFAGIAPTSAPGFIVAQFVGAALGLALIVVLYPRSASAAADNAVIPHAADRPVSNPPDPTTH
ncbi:MIP/aquaporin family protein [Nocardia sp. NPDC050718]|uniref:MIP/aquaporin family protein n=1 Tax=Nocardia sp. NPDC050718 TaxID=3155788 RepID=UPI0033D3D6BC